METLANLRPVLLAALSLAAAPSGDPSRTGEAQCSSPDAPPGYEVHEWGTFTSVLDPEGRALHWNPFQFFAPLPGFVHGLPKPSAWGTVRMETPVLYFHAERPLTVDVRVGFPDGTLTEWYPAAEAGGSSLAWREVEVLPGLDALLATSLSGEHYYAARGVDAAHVRAAGETEKFLFYRGVGSFEQPLAIRLAGQGEGRMFFLENRGADPIRGVFLFENRDGLSALLELGTLAGGGTVQVERSALELASDLSLAPLERLLRAHGLFEDEAQAMLATWRRDWFEPGLRALYVLPRARTDALLPLEIQPAPRILERVLVGRLELIEPELERSILEVARAVAAGRSRPERTFDRLGARLTRFALAVLQSRQEDEPELEAVARALTVWLEERQG